MKHRTKEEQADFCEKILAVITNEPQYRKNIAAKIQLTGNQIRYALALLIRVGVVTTHHGGGIWKSDKQLSTKELRERIMSETGPLGGQDKFKRKKVKEEDLGPEIEIDPLTTRKCRECQRFLPKSRYFIHVECESQEEEINEDFIYATDQWSSEDDEIFFGYDLNNEEKDSEE